MLYGVFSCEVTTSHEHVSWRNYIDQNISKQHVPMDNPTSQVILGYCTYSCRVFFVLTRPIKSCESRSQAYVSDSTCYKNGLFAAGSVSGLGGGLRPVWPQRIQELETTLYRCLWCYSECVSTPGKLKRLPYHGENQIATFRILQ
jgi:hypothetical protein